MKDFYGRETSQAGAFFRKELEPENGVDWWVPQHKPFGLDNTVERRQDSKRSPLRHLEEMVERTPDQGS